MKHMVCSSFAISLFVTGENITEACQEYCDNNGLCVTITETNYVFTGGSEKGYIIGLINYPRFPKNNYELMFIAEDLGHFLMKKCNPQGSYTLQTPNYTHFITNRIGD